jgi:type VI secretion system secreted protein Hcp
VAFEAFLKLAGVIGDVTVRGHEGEIAIESYSFGVAHTGSAGGGTGGGQGKATFTDVALTAALSSASPQLFLACASGKNFPEAVLSLQQVSAGGGFQFFKVTLRDVLVSGYQHGGATADNLPRETISLNFAAMKLDFTPQTDTGASGQVVSGGWDVRQNGPFTG